MGVAAPSAAGRETAPPPMQFILVLYSSHKYTKKGGTRAPCSDSETATTGTWTECRAARDGSESVPTLSGDIRAGELCVPTR